MDWKSRIRAAFTTAAQRPHDHVVEELAQHARVMRQLLVESLLLGLTGGAAGLILAWMLHRLMPSLLPADFPRVDDLGVDTTVILFALLVSVLTSIVFGMLPALHARRLNLVESLAEDGAAPVGAGTRSRTHIS